MSQQQKIILTTQPNAEDNAMLQALYSRSAASVVDHLAKLEKVGSGKFMSEYYLGYGHGSIGDCGFATIYFEGISMLAAKAIEDNPLFNGQECSTRYIDYSNQPFVNPYDEPNAHFAVEGLFSAYRQFYVESLPLMKAALRERFPKPEGENDVRYEKAITARAFDVLGAFLPPSATTNVAWTTSLRKAQDHLIALMHHPLQEVRAMAFSAFKEFYKQYPNSFESKYAQLEDLSPKGIEDFLVEFEGREKYVYLSEVEHFYSCAFDAPERVGYAGVVDPAKVYTKIYSPTAFAEDPLLMYKPKRTPLPRHSARAQEVWDILTVMDYRSFRDIQRHRNGYCSNPMIDGIRGFHPWYFNQMPVEVQIKARALLDQVDEVYRAIVTAEGGKDQHDIVKAKLKGQYLLPMGTLVGVDLKYTIAQTVYVAELRSGKTVHPTVRPFAQALGDALERQNIGCYYDKDEGDWTLKRGDQDIIQKS
ncbi:Thymidylate synthase complementing protein [compost metagenome]